MLDLVKKYIEKMVRMEKNKYMRERVYYQRNNEIAMYEQANKAYLNCRKDVEDNLIKQAKTVCKPDPNDFNMYFGQYYEVAQADDGADDITSRITEYEARKFWEMWTQIQLEFAKEKERLQEAKRNGTATAEDEKKMK